MTILTTAIQEAIAELEKGDVLCEINVAHILRQALADAPIDADAQRDAERYRWLRKSPNPACDIKLAEHFCCGRGEDFDAKIDAERAAQGGVMGQAKQRGSFEDRKNAAIQKAANELTARKEDEARRKAAKAAFEATLAPEERERRRVRRHNAVMLGVILSAGVSLERS